MNKIQLIKKKINDLRDHLHRNMANSLNLADNEIVSISQELDRALNQYYKLLK